MYMWAPYGTYDWRQMYIYVQAPNDAREADVMFRSWWDCTGGTTYWDDLDLSPRSFPTRGALIDTYQAENSSSRSGGSILNTEHDYTGTGYFVTNEGVTSAYLEWNNVAGTGSRVLSLRYSWEGNVRPIELLINGTSQGSARPTPTGRRGSWASHIWQVNLPNSTNTVRLNISAAGGAVSAPLIDKLEVYAVR
jgi:hypothetical protein